MIDEQAEPGDSRLNEGTMLAHYRVRAPLGSGAMGTVYLAHDTSLERSVAVKVLHGDIAREPELVRRFEREARAAARVSHPNLTHVYFVGDERDRRFFVMEYVPGASLFDHVQEHGPLPFEQALDILRDAAKGLKAAHDAGVIHRDIKPSNLMLLPNGLVKVTDFGLAKSITGDVDATRAGRVMGTPRYMSPEQCKGDPVDARTDVYALGLTGYYLLTGEHAYDGDSLGRVIADQLNKPLPDMSLVRDDLPESARELLSGFCAKDPSDRPATMDEVLQLIEAARPKTIDPAPLFSRGGAFIVDAVLMFSTMGASLFGVALLDEALFSGVLPALLTDLLGGAVTVALVFLLLPFMEWKWGASPGKLAFQIRVVRAQGGRPGWGALVGRLALRLPVVFTALVPDMEGFEMVKLALWGLEALLVVSGVACFLLLARQTMSDVLTRTRVVHLAAPTPVRARPA